MQAWLLISPDGYDKTNGNIYGGDLPEIHNGCRHLPEFLHEIGTAGQGVNGLVPLTFLEIEAWSRMTNVKLSPFESKALRNMSSAYASVINSDNAECPIQTGVVRDNISNVNASAWQSLSTSA